MEWRAVISDAVQERGGLATRRQLLERLPRQVLDSYIGRGHLVRVFPRVYRMRSGRDDDHTLLRAALLHGGPEAALSHTTALAVWGLRPLERPLHLTVDQSVKRAGAPGLVVHRRLRFDPRSAQCVLRQDLLVTALPRSIIDSWPLLPPRDRRPFVLDLANRGLVTAGRLDEALAERPNVAGRRGLRQTIDLLADGVRSELEAHGVLKVFRHRSLPPSVGQYTVQLPGRRIRLDRAWPEAKLAVELDGAQHHTSPEQRQKDLARDRELAALGWVVLRFTYADVLRDPDGVRAKVLEVYRARMEQLRVG
ncbi:endonuclease domain-containing protein [Geodermatophilus sp. SYSU D00815]